MKATVVIPTLNERECIAKVLQDIPKEAVHEVLIVDGHSTDGTPEIVRQLGYRAITQPGKGYGDAINTGVAHADGDVIITMDADGSYNADDIPRLLKKLEEGCDIVYGSRYAKGSGSDDDTLVSYIGNKVFTFLLNILHGVKISDSLFLYIAAKKRVFETIEMKSQNFEYCIEFPIKAHKAGFTYTEIPSREKKRTGGDSKVNAVYHGFRILWVLLKEIRT